MTPFDAIAYLGDPASAAAYALAGIDARSPAHGEELAAFERARRRARVVLLDAACAQRLPVAELEAALAAAEPLVVIVPGEAAVAGLPDPVARARKQLGMDP